MSMQIGSRSVVGWLSQPGKGVFSPEEYGATRNGTADDSAAIQAAVTACASAGGGTVELSRGTYKVVGPIVVAHDGVEIVGQGSGNTTIDFAPTSNGAAFEFSKGALSTWFCGIRGITFRSSDTSYQKTMVRLVDVRGFVARDLVAHDGQWTGHLSVGLDVYGREEIRIRDCPHFAADIPIRFGVNPNLALFSLDHSSVEGSQFIANALAPVVIGPLDNLVWDQVTHTCTRFDGGSWIVDGANVNAKLVVTGSDLNDGTLTVSKVTAAALTFKEVIATDADDDSVTFTLGDRCCVEFHPESIATNTEFHNDAFCCGTGAILLATNADCLGTSHHVTIRNCRCEQAVAGATYYYDFSGVACEIQDLVIENNYVDSRLNGLCLSAVRGATLISCMFPRPGGVHLSIDALVNGITLIGCYFEAGGSIIGLEYAKGVEFVNSQCGVGHPCFTGGISRTTEGRRIHGMRFVGGANGWYQSGATVYDRLEGCEFKDQTSRSLYVQTSAEVEAVGCNFLSTLDDRSPEYCIACNNGATVRLRTCRIVSSASGAHIADPIVVDSGTLEIDNVSIYAPTAEDNSHGVMISGTAVVRIDNFDVTLENHGNSDAIFLYGTDATVWRSGRVTLTGPANLIHFSNGATQAQCNWGATQLGAGGTVTVPCLWAKAGMHCDLSVKTIAGAPGALRLGAIVDGTSFDITSTNAGDTSTIAWHITSQN